MAIEHLQVRDVERQRTFFEQQIEELLSLEMKAKERKIAEGEDEEVLKWGLRLKKELDNYTEIWMDWMDY